MDALRLTKVPLGISFIFYSFTLHIFIFILLILTLTIPFTNSLIGTSDVIQALSGIDIGFGMMGVVGMALCMTAPDAISGKTLIYFAVLACVLALLGSSVLVIFSRDANQFATVSKNINGFLLLLWTIGLTCFLMFLQRLGQFMQNNELTDTSTKLFKFGRKYINLFLVIIVLLQLIFSVKSFIFFSFIIGLLFFALMVVLVWWVWHYLRLLFDFKNALTTD